MIDIFVFFTLLGIDFGRPNHSFLVTCLTSFVTSCRHFVLDNIYYLCFSVPHVLIIFVQWFLNNCDWCCFNLLCKSIWFMSEILVKFFIYGNKLLTCFTIACLRIAWYHLCFSSSQNPWNTYSLNISENCSLRTIHQYKWWTLTFSHNFMHYKQLTKPPKPDFKRAVNYIWETLFLKFIYINKM